MPSPFENIRSLANFVCFNSARDNSYPSARRPDQAEALNELGALVKRAVAKEKELEDLKLVKSPLQLKWIGVLLPSA